jgi:hypothetical protein
MKAPDIPIIFSAPMIRALLDGRKTQTRRLAWRRDPRWGDAKPIVGSEAEYMLPRPWQRVKAGDRLWVRESLSQYGSEGWHYSADKKAVTLMHGHPSVTAMIAWAHHQERNSAPSIHMPRWASRLTLVVTATKIERVREISNDDAEAEGIESELWEQAVGYRNYETKDGWFCTWPGVGIYVKPDQIRRLSFCSLWKSLHGVTSWDSNPEVVALTFVVHKQNIDTMPKEIAA